MSLLFIFDMDDVLYDYDWRVRMDGLTELTGIPLGELRELWWHDDGEWAGEAGVFETPDAYLSAFTAAIGVDVDEDEWVRVRGSAMAVRPEAIAAVRRASQLGRITLLTNNNALTAKHIRTLAPELIDVFGEHMLTSSHYGARKPNPLVFERVLAAYDTSPRDAFFADDMHENVAGARSIGITSYHYGSAAGMLDAIETFAAARR
ncbi:HAD-IA family hydrolase [Salinibacterium sp. G-O1]|uniref:HAD-IA family hydrolase n=1 Tax=Salinibacterium sp. G-O1 TaxID=3046208 RepID=UPI0024BB2E62|nr:HAD-IA family hydrolase [Salinibacterium sp. G-O1]MDJ0334674.1 HAD-IA family hydrolase [Salinibacterium sp. G-O1]